MRGVVMAAATLLGCVFIATPPAGAQTQQTIPLYGNARFVHEADAGPAEVERQYRMKQLQGGAYGDLTNFTAKARLSLKTESRLVLGDTRAFTVKSMPAGAGTPWREDDGWRIARREGKEGPPPLVLPIAPADEGKPYPLADFDELWVDYSASPSVAPCDVQASFQANIPLRGDEPGTRRRVTASTGDWPGRLTPLVTVDAAGAAWSSKEYAYVARRLLRLAPDEGWRYAQADRNTVVQRRLHVPLANVEELLVTVAPGTIVGHVNLLFSAKDDYRPGELLEFPGPHPVTALPDGRHALRINLRDALQRRFPREWAENATHPGRHPFHLQEVLAFIPGEAAPVSAGRPVTGLVFLGHDGENLIHLPHLRVELDGNRRRMVFGLREVTRKPNATFESAALALVSPREASSCALRIDEVKTVGVHHRNVPSIMALLDRFADRWGATSNAAPRRHDEVEYPNVVAFLPLSTLTVTDGPPEEAVQYVVKPGPSNQLRLERSASEANYLPYRVLGANGREVVADRTRLVSTVGAVLRAEGPMPRATADQDLLGLEGKSRALEISWPLRKRLDDNALFFLGVAEGAGDIGRVTLFLDFADGRAVQRDVAPNVSLPLRLGDVELRHVRLRMEPSASPFRLKLRDIAVYSRASTTLADAFTILLPKRQPETPLVLQGKPDSTLTLSPGLIAGVTPPRGTAEPVVFSVPFDVPVDWVRGLQIEHQLPPVRAAGAACQLKVRFNWIKGPTENQLCFDRSAGAVFIPMAAFIGDAAQPPDLGALKSIEFALGPHIPLPGQEAPQAFSLRVGVEAQVMVSAADELRHLPPFTAAGKAVPAKVGGIDQIVAANFPGEIWLPLADGAMTPILAAQGKIEPTPRWPYDVVQVVAEAKQAVALEPVPKSAAVPTTARPTPWPGRFAVIGALLLGWATWRKASRPPARLFQLVSASWGTACRAGRAGLDRSVRWGCRWLPHANLVIAALALGPGLWFAGRLGMDFPGVMVLVTSLLVLWAGYRHWQVLGRGLGSESSIHLALAASVVALGCIAWSLGKFGLRREGLWGLLPLLAATYAFAPAIYQSTRRFAPDYRRLLMASAYLVAAAALYGFGFPALGGLATAVSLATLIKAFEPTLRSVVPGMAGRMFGGAGNLYFSTALVMMVGVAVAMAFKHGFLSDAFSVIVYFCILIGIVKECWALARPNPTP